MSWRSVLVGAALSAVLIPASTSWTVNAAEPLLPYPVPVVTLVTHSSPGGGSDVFLREMVRHLRKHVDATFIVENVSGGSGARALARVANAEPDGSVLYATTPTYILISLLSPTDTTYEDLDPVVNFFTDSEVIYTRADGPFQTLKDVIDQARETRGRWGAANPASLERQLAEQLKRAAHVDAAIVSYDGGGDLMINVLNGTLDIGVGEIGETRAQLEAGQIRLLAVFNPARMPAFPDVPMVQEYGYDVVLEKFRGLAGPNGMPQEVFDIWNEAAKRLLADPEYQASFESENLFPDYMAHADYVPFIEGFMADTAGFLRDAGVIE